MLKSYGGWWVVVVVVVAFRILVSAQGPLLFGFGTKGFGDKGLGPGLDKNMVVCVCLSILAQCVVNCL